MFLKISTVVVILVGFKLLLLLLFYLNIRDYGYNQAYDEDVKICIVCMFFIEKGIK